MITCTQAPELADAPGPGVATRQGRRQKPRFLAPEAKLMSEKSAAGDFFPIDEH
jgi:hypothetical protein